MSAEQDIARLLGEWRELTRAEGVAIQSANWNTVQEIQSRKSDLQKSLATAEANWVAENSANQSAPKPFRAEVARLISLEARNADLLAAQMRRARAQQETLKQAWRNLRKIQRSYVAKSAPTAWQCYS
jgi:hypothetical protein